MAGFLACANHSERVATFECLSCRKHVCKDCTRHTWTKDGFVEQCPGCGETMAEIEGAEAHGDARDIPSGHGVAHFLEQLPGTALSVFSQHSLLACFGLAVAVYAILRILLDPTSLLMSFTAVLLVAALQLTTYFHFIYQTALGEEGVDLSRLLEDLGGALLRFGLAWSPILLAMAWFGEQTFGSALFGLVVCLTEPQLIFEATGPATLYVVGILLLPLLTVIAAISHVSSEVLNPAIWIHTLKVLGPTYPVAAAFFYGTYGLERLVWDPMMHKYITFSVVPALALTYLPMLLRARILGLLCEPHLRGHR